jgi:hypothetical protein
MKSKGAVEVARGTVLRVQLAMPGFVIEDAEDFLAWQGTISNATFLVQVPQKMPLGSYPGTVSFYAGGLRIARLHFTAVVGPRETPPAALPAREQRLRSAFASYASPDRDAVLARVQGIQKALPSLDIFLDVASLRSGQRWQEQLHEAVTKRDVFYLFWSQHARNSRWVDWEWRTALATRGIEFIDPVPLASPEEVHPPRELAGLHFSDSWLAFLRHKGAGTCEERTEGRPPAGAEPRLLVLRGQRRNVEYPIYEGLNFIGRAGEKPVDIDLEDQERPDRICCSHEHALVSFKEGRLFLEDCNSANGTYLNRNRVHPGRKQPLKVNDIIQIGTVQLKVLV